MVYEKYVLHVSRQKTFKKINTFCFKTWIYQNKTIFMMSFLHYDITMVITFYILNFNIILAIFDIIFKAVYITSILRAKKMHNTSYGPFVGFFNGWSFLCLDMYWNLYLISHQEFFVNKWECRQGLTISQVDSLVTLTVYWYHTTYISIIA